MVGKLLRTPFSIYSSSCAANATRGRNNCWSSLLVLLGSMPVTPSHSETYICTHAGGSSVYQSSSVQVLKNGEFVKVHRIENGGVTTDDYWSYRVISEKDGFGFRAARFGSNAGAIPTSNGMDIEYGGELFIVLQQGVYKALAVGNGVLLNESKAESLLCTVDA